MPFDWGINEVEDTNSGGYTKTSIWKSKGNGAEFWAADFEDGPATILSVKVIF